MARRLKIAGAGVRALAAIWRRVGRVQGRMEARRAFGLRSLGALLMGLGLGAAAQYLFDPHQGKRRRHIMRDKAMSMLRRRERRVGRTAHRATARAMGAAAKAIRHRRDTSRLNDPALAAKVESEMFRPANAPKKSVDVNAEQGVVYLRGQVESIEQMDSLLAKAREIDGVSRVENLLHLPGEPPRHKG